MHETMDSKSLTLRKNKLVELMKKRNVKSVILSPSMNMFYLTGFNTFPGERLLVSILDDCGKVTFVVPKLYEQEVREKAAFDQLMAWDDSENPVALLEAAGGTNNYNNSTVAIEDTMWFSAFEKIYNTYKNVNFIKASEVIGEMRKNKTSDEADKMRISSRLAEQALEVVIPQIKAGMKETEVKDILEAEMKRRGLSEASFDTIVGSGPNSALPHYTAGDKIIRDGDSVVIDFGGVYSGYCSDMTRTVMVGEASEEYRKVYEIVKAAQQRAVEAVRPGVKASDIDAAARKYIEDKGYGEYFIHRTGHGIGLEIHEEPYISNSSRTILEPGMVFSIEPGIYLPGKFGVRIEDLVLVTENGAEDLNKFNKELIVV